MQKKSFMIPAFFGLLLLMSTFALAAGSSTRNRESAQASTQDTNQIDSRLRDPTAVQQCGDQPIRQDRIKCRLEIRKEQGESTEDDEDESSREEACRALGATSKEECIRLHRESRTCYAQDGRQKVACLRDKAGVTRLGLAQSPKENKRQYVVLLLYELQERVEKLVENGKLTADEGALLVEQIIQAKESILKNESRAEIRQNMVELKQAWQRIVVSQRPTSPTNNTAPTNETNSSTGGNSSG